MVPFFQINAFAIGPLVIQVWGLLVSLGILAGIWLGSRLAKRFFLSPAVFIDLAIWAVVGGIIGGRLAHIILYEPGYYWSYPLEIFQFWKGGASSLGGFVGAWIGVLFFKKKRKISWPELLPYFDIGALSLWLGWGIGRIGCFLIHDHPGTLSSFVGAVQFPEGARHDLGLYESLVGFALFGIFFLLCKKIIKQGWGLVAGYSFISYAIARFFLDFLRATDVAGSDARYFLLTPAQWGAIAFMLALTSVHIFGRMKNLKNGRVA